MLINNCRLAGYSRGVARFKFGVTGQGSNSQSATIHSTNVTTNKMKRIYIYILGLISGIVLMIFLDYILTDYSYVELQSDFKIANIGQLEKGAKLKIEKGFSEGFTRYSLLLNLHDGENY